MLLNWVCIIQYSIFKTLEVVLHLSEVQLARYGRKRLFDDFEIGFWPFNILFLVHWRLFCVDLRYI